MNYKTEIGIPITSLCVSNYIDSLVNRFFKILPICETDGKVPVLYVKSLQSEILGLESFIVVMHFDASILTLLSILQYLSDEQNISVHDVKREVFRAISICGKLKDKYGNENGGDCR